MKGLGFLPGGNLSRANAVSGDGSVVIGSGNSSSSSDEQSWKWNANEGITAIGNLPGATYSYPFGISTKGDVIVGVSDTPLGVAYLWDSVAQIRNAQSVLASDFGLANEMAGWTLRGATSFSSEARTLVGVGINPSGKGEAWLARLYATKLLSIQINDGSPQRSRVTSLTVTFDSPVNLSAGPSDAFQLKRQSDNAVVATNATLNNNAVTLTFLPGAAVEFGSLADGRYELTVLASKINNGNFDGNGDGIGGDNYVFASAAFPDPPTNIFRLFGDADGNGSVNSIDFATFRSFFGIGTSFFDFNNDGQTNSDDFAAFRLRFGLMV